MPGLVPTRRVPRESESLFNARPLDIEGKPPNDAPGLTDHNPRATLTKRSGISFRNMGFRKTP